MNTIVYECGCSISYNMYGDKEVLDAHMCDEHSKEYPNILEMIAKIIREIHA